MKPWPDPICLDGRHVCLRPLAMHHHDGLVEAVKDGEAYRLWYTNVPTPSEMGAEIARRLALREQGLMLPFTVMAPGRGARADAIEGAIVGQTTYMNIDAANRRLEIGSTWYCNQVQKTPLNTECKFLLLQHAFETLDCIAVEFRTHFFNQQSRRAIERLGARLDGVLRSHSIMANGTLRDTAVYSIVASEWPTVKAHLQWQLEKPRP